MDVVIGTQPSGQGHETSFAQVVSDLLHVPVESVKIILGDTDVVKVGGGSHRAAPCAMPRPCSPRPRPSLSPREDIAAAILDRRRTTCEFSDGRFSSRDTNRTFDFLELARETARHELPGDLGTAEGRHRRGDRQ